ncbi:MAG TPA: CheR family methyltransferase [bacterium]|nr:CheR family methyltransferase [bacterium]
MIDTARIFKLKMTAEEVEKFQAFFMDNSGLVFEGRRIQEMERAIARRMIELGFSSFSAYHDYVSGTREGKDELNDLVISLTVGETQFFRTPDQFAALRKYVLPELIQRQRRNNLELRILSAGCATGEEPYSLDIMLNDLVPDLDSWNASITACDINREFLRAAQESIYSERKLRLVDPVTRELYFERLAKNRWKVGPVLRRRIEWHNFNITADNFAPLAKGARFHLILCRNVLIYFNLKTIKKVIEKLYEHLEPDGYLMLGYSETLFKISEAFQSVHTPEAFFYLKTGAPARPVHSLPEKPEPYERREFLEVLASRQHPWVEQARADGANETSKFLKLLASRNTPPPGDGASARPMSERAGAGPAPLSPPPPAPPARPAPPPAKARHESQDEMYEEALKLFAEERFDESRRKFEEMERHDPCSARAHLGLGLLYANLGVEDRSRELAEKARSYNDLLPEIYFLLALLDEKNGQVERAVENYQRVILLAPDFAVAHFNLANLHLKLRRHRDARREFKNTIVILERDRDNSSLRFSGGLTRESLIRFCEMQTE